MAALTTPDLVAGICTVRSSWCTHSLALTTKRQGTSFVSLVGPRKLLVSARRSEEINVEPTASLLENKKMRNKRAALCNETRSLVI